MMLRTEVIQTIIDHKNARTYLEIGVEQGTNFFPIKVISKTAVDPSFTFSSETKAEWIAKNNCNVTANFNETTSDNFFASKERVDRFDVVFIDGLHTHEQSLQDVLNALDNLQENGVIVMHDCKPPNIPAACPTKSLTEAMTMPDWSGEWCGDVWKTILYLRSNRPDLRVFVLDCDYGLGIVTKGASDSILDMSKERLEVIQYEEVMNGQENLLNLKEPKYLYEFLKTI
jgi:Methyltransferase domain